jgi:hypothetical protein
MTEEVLHLNVAKLYQESYSNKGMWLKNSLTHHKPLFNKLIKTTIEIRTKTFCILNIRLKAIELRML